MPEIEQEDQELLDDLVNDNEHLNQPDGSSEKETQTKQKAELDEVEQPAEVKERVITQEDIEEIGLPRGYLGKPYADTLKSLYVNIRSMEKNNSKEIADLQKQLKGFEEQLSKKEITQAKETVEEKLPDYETEIQKIYDKYIDDDGYTDKKGLGQALAKFNADYQKKHDELLKKEFIKLMGETNKNFNDKLNSTSKTAQSIQEKENQIALVDNVAELLGSIYGEDKIDQKLIQAVFKEYESYAKEISEDMTEEEAGQFFGVYKGKPEKLAKEVIRIHKSNLHGKKSVEQTVDDIHKKQVDKLKKQSKTFVQSATAARDKVSEDSDPEYDELLKEAGEDGQNWTDQITAGAAGE